MHTVEHLCERKRLVRGPAAEDGIKHRIHRCECGEVLALTRCTTAAVLLALRALVLLHMGGEQSGEVVLGEGLQLR